MSIKATVTIVLQNLPLFVRASIPGVASGHSKIAQTYGVSFDLDSVEE